VTPVCQVVPFPSARRCPLWATANASIRNTIDRIRRVIWLMPRGQISARLRGWGLEYSSNAVARLSGKLRLTQLSRYTRAAELSAVAARNAGPKPWEDWRGGGRSQ
jgi:hypothetical protein